MTHRYKLPGLGFVGGLGYIWQALATVVSSPYSISVITPPIPLGTGRGSETVA